MVGGALKQKHSRLYDLAEAVCHERVRDAKNTNSTNAVAVLLTWLCTMMEASAIDAAMQFLEEKQAQVNPRLPAVGVYKFDGFLAVNTLLGDDGQQQILLDEMANAVKHTTHIDGVKFAVKPMQTDIDFLARYRPDQHDTLPTEWVENLGEGRGVVLNASRLGDVLDYDPAAVSDWYIHSSYKSGKSWFSVEKVIRSLCAYILEVYKRQARIVSLSPRKTLCAQQIALLTKFGFVPYSVIKGQLDYNVNPRTVWQVDSLPRALQDQDGNVPDLIWIDEAVTNIAQCFFRSKDNHSTVTRALAGLSGFAAPFGPLTQTPRILVTDADLSQATISAFTETVRRGREFRVVKNLHTPWKDQLAPVSVYTGPAAETTLTAKLLATIKEQNRRRLANEPWTGVVVACHSKKLCDALLHAIVSSLGVPEELCASYTSETDEHKKRDDLYDVAKVWATLLVVLFTATINVGVDCPIWHLKEAFMFLTSGNASVCESLQMGFRARLIQLLHICFSGRCDKTLPKTVDEVLQYATMSETTRQLIPDTFRADRSPIMAHYSQKRPERNVADLRELVEKTFIGRCWLEHTLRCFRSQRDFLARMEGFLTRMGLEVIFKETKSPPVTSSSTTMATTTTTTSAPSAPRQIVKATRRLMAKSKAEVDAERIRMICENVAQELEKPSTTWRRLRTAEEQAGELGHTLMSAFAVGLSTVQDKAWVGHYLPYLGVFQRLKAHSAMPFENRHGPQTTVCTPAEKMWLAVEVLKTLFELDMTSFGGQKRVEGKTAVVGGDRCVVLNRPPSVLLGFLHGQVIGQLGRAFHMELLTKSQVLFRTAAHKQVLMLSRLKTWLYPLLHYVGLNMTAAYTAQERKAKSTAMAYLLSWQWLSGKKKNTPPPKPIPHSPTAPAYVVSEIGGTPTYREKK